MRILLAISMLALLLPAALPSTEATGGSQSFRIITSIDALLVGLSQSCQNPNPSMTNVCWGPRQLGYDGVSGAATAIPDHLNHAFACAITSSVIPTVGAPTDPSFWVGFDLNNDGQSDTKYGGRTTRPAIGAATGELTNRINNLDVVGVANWPSWYAGQVQYNGPSSAVSGNVDHERLIIWLESGLDTTIDCTF